MARRCELTGKGVMSGNKVSHANNKNKRQFKPNLCNVSLASEVLEEKFSFKVSASALRSVEHNGGLDHFLMKAKKDTLSTKAKHIKKKIEDKQAAAQA